MQGVGVFISFFLVHCLRFLLARTLPPDLTGNLGKGPSTGVSRSQQQEPEAVNRHASNCYDAVSNKGTIH